MDTDVSHEVEKRFSVIEEKLGIGKEEESEEVDVNEEVEE
jgi:hypothetical protein